MTSLIATPAHAVTVEPLAPETVLVPAGTFAMGSLEGRPDERPVRDVTVASFRLGRTPVRNAEYASFLAESDAAQEPPWWRDPSFAAPDQPVVGITWSEAVAFTVWLGLRLGGRWRLPTEAEWERAMRGGREGALTCWGGDIPPSEIPEGPIDGPWALGTGTPNGFGVLDCGTVVHEWCLDLYAPYDPAEAARADRADRPERRSSRGGSWRHRQRWSPPSARSSLPPLLRYADYGFRVLREEA
jgi:formylglycine-generating enzyme required for sulfatase activity